MQCVTYNLRESKLINIFLKIQVSILQMNLAQTVAQSKGYILFQLYKCYKRLGRLFYIKTSYGIYYFQVFIVYSEYYGIRMAKLMKTWQECPECHEWYHKSCVRIPPTAYCPITGDIDNYTCRPCINSAVAVL